VIDETMLEAAVEFKVRIGARAPGIDVTHTCSKDCVSQQWCVWPAYKHLAARPSLCIVLTCLDMVVEQKDLETAEPLKNCTQHPTNNGDVLVANVFSMLLEDATRPSLYPAAW
jgi:hypothetical protein